MKNVLVTDSNSRKALCVVRSLGRQGYNVIAVSDSSIDMSRVSKYCTFFKKLPNPIKKKEGYLNELRKIIETKNIDVIIPMEDETVELIIENKDLFMNVHTLLPDLKTFMIARDKALTMSYAEKFNISIPKTYTLSDVRDIDALAEKIEYPIVIKPRISSGSRGLIYVDSKEDLIKKYRETHINYPFPIIQQYIDGDFEKIQVLVVNDKQCKTIASCTYQGIREFPVDGGPVTMWKTVSNPELENITYNLLKRINWIGFAEVEYIYNPNSGEYYLIEINPRFSANIALAVNVGVDFPNYLVKLSMDEKVQKKFNDIREAYCQWLIPGDLLNFIFNKNRFKQEVGYFFKKPKNLTYAILSKQDPMPMVANILSLFTTVITNFSDLLVKLKSSKR